MSETSGESMQLGIPSGSLGTVDDPEKLAEALARAMALEFGFFRASHESWLKAARGVMLKMNTVTTNMSLYEPTTGETTGSWFSFGFSVPERAPWLTPPEPSETPVEIGGDAPPAD